MLTQLDKGGYIYIYQILFGKIKKLPTISSSTEKISIDRYKIRNIVKKNPVLYLL